MKGSNMKIKHKSWIIAIAAFSAYIAAVVITLYFKNQNGPDALQKQRHEYNHMLAEILAEQHPTIKEMYTTFNADGTISDLELQTLRGHWIKIAKDVK